MAAILAFFKQLPWQKAIMTVVLAVLCLLAVKIILAFFDKFLKKSKIDPLVKKILRIFVKAFLLSTTVIIVLGNLGVIQHIYRWRFFPLR